jgi:hypothetical protein
VLGKLEKARLILAAIDHELGTGAFARFLVACGIDAISITPDSLLGVKTHVAAAEAGRRDARKRLA